jgi:putative FmdB family regulatory protein
MPIYEYRCSACQHELEAIQKFSDSPLVACPQCGKESLVKLVSAAGFQLKGSGWYQTDFRNSGSKQAPKPGAEGDTAKAADGAKGEGAKGEGGNGEGGKGEGGKSEGAKTETPAATPSAPAKSDAAAGKPAAPSTPASA